MSIDVTDESHEVDLSKLISFSMSFEPLQLLFHGIIKRVGQTEFENVRQDDEIEQLKKQVEELQRRDAEREAQLQELLLEQEKLRRKKSSMQKTEGDDKEDAADKEGGGEAVDLRSLWDEVNHIKRLMGEFQRPSRRHTIEELYEARKRHVSSADFRRSKSSASVVRGELASEGEMLVGDSILNRAREQLLVSGGAGPQTPPPGESSARTGESVEPPRRSGEKRPGLALHVSEEEVQVQGLEPEGEEGESEVKAGEQEQQQPQRQQEEHQPLPQLQPLYGEEEKQHTPQSSAGKGAGGDSSVPVFSGSGEGWMRPSRTESPVFRDKIISGSGDGTERVSQLTTPSQSREKVGLSDPKVSIYERLRRDGGDIEYLNRVVAEILNEMKDLHADVDFMRTTTFGREDTDKERTMDPDADRERTDLRRRVRDLEEAVSDLQKQLGSATASAPAMQGTEDMSGNRRRSSAWDDLKGLRDRLNALDQAHERMSNKLDGLLGSTPPAAGDAGDAGDAAGDAGGAFDAVDAGGDSGVSSAQMAMMAATVNTLEKQLADLQRLGLRNYDEDLDDLRAAVEKLQQETETLEKTCTQLDEKKEDKDGRRRQSSFKGSFTSDRQTLSPTNRDPGDYSAAIQDLLRREDELQRRMLQAEMNVKDLDEVKADRTAFQRLADDLKHLRQLLELSAGKRGDEDAATSAAALQEELMQKLQQQMSEHLENFNQMRDGTTSELDALRDYVEQIDHRKADAMLVANKAERDYVENALERLMREVEQVLNATNAGLIDTLDKSLNVLRDMLEGKATKNDMDNLRRLVSEEQIGGGAADGLMGFRGFRCLGCNRPVESMRPRVAGGRLQPFVNRLPQNHPGDTNPARIQQGPSSVTDSAPKFSGHN